MRLRLATLILFAAISLAGAQAAQDGPRPPIAEPQTETPASAHAPKKAPPETPPAVGAAPAAARACIPEREIAIDPAAGPLHLGLKTYRQTLALHDHEVVLTFDDGPARDTTPKILDALEDACVHATFFLIGRHAAEHPPLARREVAEHHSVGHRGGRPPRRAHRAAGRR